MLMSTGEKVRIVLVLVVGIAGIVEMALLRLVARRAQRRGTWSRTVTTDPNLFGVAMLAVAVGSAVNLGVFGRPESWWVYSASMLFALAAWSMGLAAADVTMARVQSVSSRRTAVLALTGTFAFMFAIGGGLASA